ncbi:hypothetical protein DDB_G0270940 [Dictyostelium discoideum AX4]|uniref:Uncharacterized protein n=1 Tax=Dictyostelium discoideum TaxID=44689 RepID=Q55D74_DICDI|nr:hypothetical protein DDB_G0270940 [Dictyostelium discoideum AX4]EAL72820.1 hypothetical protein DDB_G0270940 [Dictyostelium discoideum AX4]|eukprot:XP_646257.1 hypothetical protein DDB_G0270940 [Dictyostelium discoideum AX4]
MKLILLFIFLVLIKLISCQQNIQDEEQQNHFIVFYSNHEGAIDYVYSRVKEVLVDDNSSSNSNNNNKYHLAGGEISTDMIMLGANQSLGYFNNGDQKFFTIEVISNINFKLYYYDFYESIQEPLGPFSKSYSFRAINGEYIKFKIENVDQNDGYIKIYIKRPNIYPTSISNDPLIIPLNHIEIIPLDDLNFFNNHTIINNISQSSSSSGSSSSGSNNSDSNNSDNNNNNINSFDSYQSSQSDDKIESFSSEIENSKEIPIRDIDQFSLSSINTNFDENENGNSGIRNEFFEINDVVDFSEINSSNLIKINLFSFALTFVSFFFFFFFN